VSAPSGAGVDERQGLDPSTPWWGVHVARYAFARTFVESRRVLDVACGTGYGLALLHETRARVVGVDVALEAARAARAAHPEARVLAADGMKLPFADRSFEAVVSFETIEHLEDRGRFLAELARVLQDDGLLILSTPNANHTRPRNGKPRNPYHLHEYSDEELGRELRLRFGSVRVLGQYLDPAFGVPPFWDEQEKLAREGGRSAVLLWRALEKLPRSLGNLGSRALWGHRLVPEAGDYRFDESAAPSAPVLVALCRDPIRETA
jgi:SAM-dependent methyltransferase